MKVKFWAKDWFFGLVIALAVLLIHFSSNFFENIERYFYDWGVKSSSQVANKNIAVVAIDDFSIQNMGRWPWPRSQQAKLIDFISEGKPAAIGYVPLFSEPQQDPGLQYITQIRSFVEDSSLPLIGDAVDIDGSNISDSQQAKDQQPPVDDVAKLLIYLYEAEDALNADLKLATSFNNASNLITQLSFDKGDLNRKPETLPDYIQKHSLHNIEDAQQVGYPENSAMQIAIYPLKEYAEAAHGIGHLTILPDIDGKVRSEQLAIQYNNQFYPSLALMLAATYLKLEKEDIKIKLGDGVELGKLFIKTDDELKMKNFYYNEHDKPPFVIDSVFDLITKKIPVSKYRDKIVLIGPTAMGLGKPLVTPTNANMPPVTALAHIVSSILGEHFFVKPSYALGVTMAVYLLLCLYIMLLMPKLKAMPAALVTLGIFSTLLISHYLLMTQAALWLPLMLPASLLIIAYLLLTTKRFLVTERGKARSDLDNAETNKMLGLAFQGQGQLDMAFEKFRKCPVDTSIMEVLYNLALDYERKRQFAKAGNVYQYIGEKDIKFRDVEQRIARSKKMEDTLILGGGGGASIASTIVMDGDDSTKPMLGRYEIQKELGKGAMGVVYLGEDPKISRVVAIKTMALSQEFDAEELDEVKERFFREAETAGRLNHPNIVTIFDAGEEHDLAYIAMEFLKGSDLAPHTKADNLLPLKEVLSIVRDSAKALSYAHRQNVVHRDIKPANLMYDAQTKVMKITDFGIARITDASKTKTGVVLGTPSYMSPEQLAGKKVDGRSDLFSLGVMLFQMTTGELPFQADTMATLMFKITNDASPSVLSINAKLPVKLDLIITRCLEKIPSDRYASGDEIAADIEQLLAEL